MYHGRTKYIEAKYHFISEIVSQGTIIATSDDPTDMMKLVPLQKFKHCLDLVFPVCDSP